MAINFLLSAFITLFLVVDALGNLPLFESLLHGTMHRDRTRLLTLSTMVAMITLLVFTFGGLMIFDFFKIKFYSFKIAGGILLFVVAIQMLFAMRQRLAPSEEGLLAKREDIAIVPMAIPLQTGPAAIMAGIVLASRATDVTMQSMLFLAILMVFLVSYFIYIKSEYFFRFLGDIGSKVVSRVMGLILAAIAVQFVVDGILEIIKAVA